MTAQESDVYECDGIKMTEAEFKTLPLCSTCGEGQVTWGTPDGYDLLTCPACDGTGRIADVTVVARRLQR